MAEVTLDIAGRHYDVHCRDGEEAQLRRLAAIIDEKTAVARRASPGLTEVRQLLFAAILLADELLPSQLMGVDPGAVAGFATARGGPTSHVAILAAAFLWISWAYFFERYQTINWSARYFALGFIAQAVLLGFVGPSKRKLFLRPTRMRRRIGLALFFFALVLQPLIGPLLLERPWPQAEIFGMTPDPTMVATLGALLILLRGRALALAMALPLVWCAISYLTLWTMGSPDAWVMLAAMGVAIIATRLPSQEPE